MTQKLTLKEYRLQLGIPQAEAAKICSMPLRTYQNYENEPQKNGSIKYNYLISTLQNYFRIDEEHGILKLESIKNVVSSILKEYGIQYCYLFGSYARGEANEKSDVDLLIDNTVEGLKFYGLAEKLREALGKKVDLLDTRQLISNPSLLEDVLKEGIRIDTK